jgi:hypothetical protein
MIKQGFILILVLQSFLGCSQTIHEKTMKATAEKLLIFLSKNDTASIMKLYVYDDEDLPTEQAYKEELVRSLEDCKTYQKITKIHGVPKQNSYVIKEGFNGGKDLEITLFDKKDTMLNMASCKIVIQFYPEAIQNAKKFYGYRIEEGIKPSQKFKLTPAPLIPVPSKTKNN